ncbi:MAG TPA: clostripain-related cysteine peptidase [Fimbriimonas sp.]|nr:clostripain-related cysteine peptidase [Fimbriimonas sp.]
MNFLRTLLFALLVTVLFACGGSGGGTPQGITFQTNWVNRLSGIGANGISIKVSVLDSAGLPVSTLILDDPTTPVESINFDLPGGTYLVRAELYSGASAGGTKTGIFEAPVTYTSGGGVMLSTEVGLAIDNILVSPAAASVAVGRGKQFYASALSPAGTNTFMVPNSVSWTALGGIGTVSSDGNFTCNAVGTGSVRATYTPNGRLGSAAVTGTPPGSTTTGKWTILVYMNGANDLQQYSVLNMNQMERVASNSNVRFVVQWKQYPAAFSGGTFDGTRRYLAKSDFSNQINSELIQDMGTSVDMGSTQTLREFITWGKANYPAERYCLIVWNHGNGWRRSPPTQDLTRAVSYDDEKGTSIQVWDLNQALGSEQFDIISWDASLMQMVEVAYEVKDNCKFVVGSEESPPAEGLPYDLVFGPFRDNPNETTKNLTKNFVDGMLAVPSYAGKKITQSVLDTTKLGDLATSISTLGTQLNTNSVALTSLIQSSRSGSQSYSPSGNRVYRDLHHLSTLIEAGTTIPGVLNAIADVKAKHAAALVWEGHNANSANSKGISIDFSSGSVFSASASDYQRMKFAIDTQWDEFLLVAP